jgi:tetratricopeptide (TPR) repeat protein
MFKIIDVLHGLNAQRTAHPESTVVPADKAERAFRKASLPASGLPLLQLASSPAVFEIWEEQAAALALQHLQDYAHEPSSDRLSHIAIELAELGLPGRAAHALVERLDRHPEDARCWGALANVYLLAGKYEKAIAAARTGLNNRLEPLVADKVIVKAQLLMGKTMDADATLHSRRRRSSLVSSMVKHARNLKLSPTVVAEPNEIYPAEEIACFFGWRGLSSRVVEWLNATIARGDFIEVARLLRSPFIAPIRDDPQLLRIIESLGLNPQHLVAYRVDMSLLSFADRGT